MQRRAVAAYVVLFLLLGASSYATIAVAEKPPIDLEGETYAQGDSFTVGGQSYTVSELGTETSGGEHGGGAARLTGELTYVNESYRFTAELENGSTVAYEGGNYTVAIPNASNASRFALIPTNETAGGPLEFAVGDAFRYEAESVTASVAAIRSSSVTLTWTGPQEQTVDLSQGQNVTLSGQTYVVYFQNSHAVQLSPEVATYQEQVRRQERFVDRIGGLWWVTLLSGFASVLLVGLAYLPVRG